MRVRIVTDSSANVPDSYLDRLGVAEALAVVNFGAESHLNKTGMPLAEFYRRLEVAVPLPTTSQPVPQQFADAYARLAAEGADEIIAVCVSGALSGTLNSAVLAAEHAPVPVHTWDSQHVSMAAGWQAVAAAEMAQAGMAAADILAQLAVIRARVQMAFTPANLKYIVASGRAPRLRGAVGDLLNIKPILSTIAGRLEPVGQARGQRRALQAMLERVAAAAGVAPARVAVGHSNAPDQGAAYLDVVGSRLNMVEGFVFDVGPALATLGGPGLVGLAVCPA